MGMQDEQHHDQTYVLGKHRHCPAEASVKLVQPWMFLNQPRVQQKYDKIGLQQELSYESPKAAALLHMVERDIHSVPEPSTLQETTMQLETLFHKAMTALFPPKTPHDNRVSASPVYRSGVKEMWSAYHACRKTMVCTVPNILKAWSSFAKFRVRSRSMKTAATSIKKEKILQTLLQLENAASKGDQIRVYQAARSGPLEGQWASKTSRS